MIKIIISIFLALVPVNVFAECLDGTNFVTRVIDGDTIEVDDSDVIRILGIDTYDSRSTRMIGRQVTRTGYDFKHVKYLAEKATSFANETLLHKCVKLVKDKRDRGAYNRLLRYVFIDGKDYQLMTLEKGLANVYCKDTKIRNFKKYLEASTFKCN